MERPEKIPQAVVCCVRCQAAFTFVPPWMERCPRGQRSWQDGPSRPGESHEAPHLATSQ